MQPCALTKLAQYTPQQSPTINSFVDIAYEANDFDFPEDFNVSLLVPDMTMVIQGKPESSTKTFNISCTPIRFQSTDGNLTVSPPSAFASKSPQLLSHLLDGSPPSTSTSTQILSPEQPKKQFILPANLKPTGNTKMYRVRLPAGSDFVKLPNNLLLKRLPDRRIVLCPPAPAQQGNEAANSEPKPSTSSASPVASTSAMTSLPCKINIDSVPFLASRIASGCLSAESCAKQTYSKKKLLNKNKAQCNNSSSSVETSERAPTNEVSEDVKKKLMGSIECLKLVFKRLDVQSLLR